MLKSPEKSSPKLPGYHNVSKIENSFDDDFDETFNGAFEKLSMNNSHQRHSRRQPRRKKYNYRNNRNSAGDSSPTPSSSPKVAVISHLNYFEGEVEYEMPPEAFTIEDVYKYMGMEIIRDFLDENGNKRIDCGRRLPRIPDEENIKIFNRNVIITSN